MAQTQNDSDQYHDSTAKVLVLYYSCYGHTATLAEGVAEGVGEMGAQVDVRRVPDTSDHNRTKAGVVPVIEMATLPAYDAIIVGSPTRYGRMAGPMASFFDKTGAIWASNALVGKIGAAFTSTGSQHGGQETTLLGILINLMHFGMTIATVPYSEKRLTNLDEVSGGTPYGASTVSAADGSRLPTANELAIAKWQGRHVADLALSMVAGQTVRSKTVQ
ncbi:NAD(P)H:quinone oxidoreductase [Eilatimonas milleporae]|uniref:NAD(P)H dehydrogenase (Quinone) n=1 Tax=Eilatimonas milleporae TaxID=911205 RepID=A0A3M0C518_9PROT|nr:NAD(P)H:quinone oxidoreductase [Eilatimonas milleporae]RMB04828.1 NAD(P)H dehydrogenase (quinone) [Eilatimonas milleporae]